MYGIDHHATEILYAWEKKRAMAIKRLASLTGALLIFLVLLYLLSLIKTPGVTTYPSWRDRETRVDNSMAAHVTATLNCRICRWTALLCSTCVSCRPPPTLPLKRGVCCCRWSWSVLPQARSWVCAHPVLTDGKGGSTVDLRWPQARGVHS